ncbi:MAG: double zinc ribbon domain-containing protein [Candidatus Moraniibacteriota bacterium]
MSIKKFILDTLFPIRCIACDNYDFWICPECFEKIKILSDQICPECKKVFTKNGEFCFACRGKNPLDGILVASIYRENKKRTVLAKLIHHFKYRFIPEIGIDLAKVLEKAILKSTLPLPDAIISVPLHSRRLRWRGFNQALEMARYLGKNLTPGFPIPVVENLLLRQRDTRPQMEIKNRNARQNNVAQAFTLDQELFKKYRLRQKTVFLIDDVATTGSTLNECAKVLKEKKVKKVYAVVLARQ